MIALIMATAIGSVVIVALLIRARSASLDGEFALAVGLAMAAVVLTITIVGVWLKTTTGVDLREYYAPQHHRMLDRGQ